MALRKKKPEVVFNWHPNFRVAETLPDIKQVRTGFLVNFITIALALAAFCWVVYLEVRIHQTDGQIEIVQRNIDDKDKTNKANLAMSKKFVTQSKNLQILAQFFDQRVPPVDILNALAAARPENMLFESVNIDQVPVEIKGKKGMSSQRITVSGVLSGEGDAAALAVEDYAAKVLASPVFKDRVADPAKDCKRDAHREAQGVWKFDVSITLKPVG